MSIYNLRTASASPLGPQRSDSVGESSRAAGTDKAAAQHNADIQGRGSEDRIEISDAGRAAQAQEDAARTRDVATGLSALRELAPTEERMSEIRQRVQDGYYTQPSTLKEVAERLANDL